MSIHNLTQRLPKTSICSGGCQARSGPMTASVSDFGFWPNSVGSAWKPWQMSDSFGLCRAFGGSITNKRSVRKLTVSTYGPPRSRTGALAASSTTTCGKSSQATSFFPMPIRWLGTLGVWLILRSRQEPAGQGHQVHPGPLVRVEPVLERRPHRSGLQYRRTFDARYCSWQKEQPLRR